MGKSWKKLGSWNVGTDDGDVEKFSLYEEENSGSFRIQNDFGNITIDMERMSGYEFIKRLAEQLEKEMNTQSDSDDWMYDLDFGDDCDSFTNP